MVVGEFRHIIHFKVCLIGQPPPVVVVTLEALAAAEEDYGNDWHTVTTGAHAMGMS